ncbi:uncharacterized protein PV09_04851 [Verruconis gallopava]|uniref:F-box domain-containing protein n=1 Tax=Verruconis gallopava TaxID=253628 RepID=A0A0D2AB82_9PEZI|nr:uncharacterized protein PV09_04851 [Verruconis gallopava]KIW04028.1 hypothetical protein PV09_04851 [Verruconis gallopava]
MGISNGAVEHAQRHSRLMSLPDELLLCVVEQIDDTPSLRSFILTCQKAQSLAEPCLWRSIVIRNGEQARMLFGMFLKRRERRAFVQHVDVKHKLDSQGEIGIFDGQIGLFSNLRTCKIESPCPNDNIVYSSTGEFSDGEGQLRYWNDLPKLNNVQSLHLHTHIRGTTYFDLCNGKGSIIFQSPTLRHIHLACTDITTEIVESLRGCDIKTPLETLVFEECNIDSDALAVILSLPKALKRLTLGERLYHFHDPPSECLSLSGPGLATALKHQAHSLEYLKQTQVYKPIQNHWFNLSESERQRRFCSSDALPFFPSLKEIDLPYGSPLYAIVKKAPPQLERIRVHHFHGSLLGQQDVLLKTLPRELNIMNQRRLSHLELIFPETRTNRQDTQEQWLETLMDKLIKHGPFRHESMRTNIWEFARRLRTRDIRLTIDWIRSAGYIPPFMDGEILPTQFNIYDSDRIDVFGHYESGRVFRDKECERRARQEGIYQGPEPQFSEHDLEEGGTEEEEEEEEELVIL